MNPASLAAVLLCCGLTASFPQSLFFPQGLHPYRWNTILVHGLVLPAERNIQITGVLSDGNEVPLFSGAGTPAPGGARRCLAYLDEQIAALRLRVQRGAESVLELEVPVQAAWPPLRVYGLSQPLGKAGGWIAEASSPRELGPGDIRALPPASDAERLRAAGIHVLLPGPAPGGTPGPVSAWRGCTLYVSPPGDAARVLEQQKANLLDFQERYRELVLKAGFYAPRLDRTAPLVFAPATPTGIALNLHREILGDRVEPLHRYALLGFSIVLLAAVILVRNSRALLALAGLLSAAFFAVSLLHPPGLRSLTVELALPEGEPRSIPLERVLPQTGEQYRYRQQGIPPGSCALVYRAFLAPGGEVPLQPFARERLLRFHPLPEVRQEGERFFLHSPSPLSAWSLHEPE